MVSRTRLALILISGMWMLGLAARPVYLPKAPALEIPAGTEITDLPSRALIRIAVFPDSSYSLLSVEPPELRPLAENYLRRVVLLSYLAENAYTPGMKELEIDITQGPSSSAPLSEQELRSRIETWIVEERDRMSSGAVWRDWIDPLASEDLNYKTANNAIGLHTGPDPLRLHQMDLPASPLGNAQRLSWLRSMYSADSGYDHSARVFPYEILLTSLDAGMGEFDSRYATVKAGRSGILGMRDLYYGLDLSVANGNWTGLNSARTNMRHHLRVPIGRLAVDLEYTSLSQDFSSIELHPAYWRSPLFSLEQKGSYFWSQLSSPWLDLAVSRRRETLNASGFAFRPQSELLQIRAGKLYQFGKMKLDAAWVHSWNESNLILPLYSYQYEYDDLGSLAWTYEGDRLELEVNAGMYDLKHAVAEAKAGWKTGKFRADIGYKSALSDYDSRTAVTDIYTVGSMLDAVDLREHGRIYAGLSFKSSDLSVSLSAGRKDIMVSIPENGAVSSFEATPLFAGLGAVVSHDFGFLRLGLKQNLLWTQERDHMRDDPAIRGFGEVELRRELNHDNAIFAALGYSFHSSYLNSYVQPDVLDFSLIADARLGVRISKLFEIDAGIRNLGDNYIFGVYPIPFSLHASLRWFFVN